MTIIADPITAVIRFLKADTDTAEMVANRVFGGEFPQLQNDNMPMPAILIRNAGGGLLPISSSYVRLYDMRLDVYSYGSTANQAFRVYRCAAGALKQMKRNQQGKTVLYWARTSSGPANLTEKFTEWSLTFSSWQVLFSESEVGA